MTGRDVGGGFALTTLAISEAAKIDGLRLIEAAPAPILLYSTQTCRSPRKGVDDCRMEIKAVPVNEPGHVAAVASLPRLLPPPPRWDARASEAGRYEILFDEAGGALYKLLLHEPSGVVVSPSAAQPLQSFTRPRFLRAGADTAARTVTASRDAKALVAFPNIRTKPPSDCRQLAEAAEGVAGESWVITKAWVGGDALFNESPGRLELLRRSTLDVAAVGSSVPFPGIRAYEFDAAPLGSDVVVFATGKPAVLLLGSRPAKAIALTAPQRPWLDNLTRPTISTGGGRVHIAAIANPGTADARIVYGDFAAGGLIGESR